MMLFKTKLGQVSKDFGLNLLSSLVSTGVAQLILYPVLSHMMSASRYGELLTIMGVANTIAIACGGSLNNTRLLLQEKYDEGKSKGDFSLLLFGLAFISSVFSATLFLFIYHLSYVSTLLVTIFAVLCLVRTYLSVEYRIILNFSGIFYSSIWVAVGNIFGLGALLLINNFTFWILPFLFGEVFGSIYVIRTTGLLCEKLKKTGLFWKVLSKEFVLLVVSISANILIYLDRLLLLPLLGGAAVSSYSVSSIFGKSLGILMTPLAGVMLGYYAHKGFRMDRVLFWKINLGTMALGILASLASVMIAPLFTRFFYSSLFAEAKKYMLIANVTAIVNVVTAMIQPSVLKFAPTVWQLVVQIVYGVVYLVGGILAVQHMGLWGFVIMALVASVTKMIILLIVGDIFIRRKNVTVS